ncbi:MAG: PDDEXK family nuclease [Bacilli bacterium]
MPLHIRDHADKILALADAIQQEADKYDIIHVFDDGGYRELLLLKMFGLKKLAGRGGDDCIDPETGQQFELKTVNLIDTSGNLRKTPGITTCHHINHEVIERYRKVSAWIVGIFYFNRPVRIYEVPTLALELYFLKWEKRLLVEEELSHINNPKIPFQEVLKHGIKHYHDENYDQFMNIKSDN